MFPKYLDNYEPYSPPILQSFNRVHPVPPVTKAELVGWILDTAAQYLYNKNFPSKLITLILVQLDKWLSSSDISSELEFHEIGNNLYDGTKLKITVITKVDQICLNSKTGGLEEEEDDRSYLETSYSTIKNGRRSLEDRLTVLTRADKLFNNLSAPLSYFGIFDGHNGWDAAAFASAQLHRYLFKHLSTKNENLVDVSEALISAFQDTDREYLLKLKEQPQPSSAAGTTASVGVILGAGEDLQLYVAWVGDSDVVLFSEGGVAESIVRPHKPGRLDEMSRILEAGGQVLKSGHSSTDTWRVSGVLAVSRAIGDVALKPWVIPDPEIFHKTLDGTEEFLILASDGLWDTVDVKRAYQIVRENLNLLECESENYDMSVIAEKLVIEAKNSGSTDNISVIVVVLRDFKRN